MHPGLLFPSTFRHGFLGPAAYLELFFFFFFCSFFQMPVFFLLPSPCPAHFPFCNSHVIHGTGVLPTQLFWSMKSQPCVPHFQSRQGQTCVWAPGVFSTERWSLAGFFSISNLSDSHFDQSYVFADYPNFLTVSPVTFPSHRPWSSFFSCLTSLWRVILKVALLSVFPDLISLLPTFP